MKVTMRDVAKKANVSLATVYRALSGSGYIKSETLELVIQACKDLGYTPALRDIETKSKSNLIAIVTADLKNEFNIYVIDGITKKAEEKGYDVVIYDQQERPERSICLASLITKIPVKGIILTPIMNTTTLGFSFLGMLEELHLPIVLVDRDLPYSHFDGVFLDNVFGGYTAVSALIQAGHQKIATITGPSSSLTGKERLTGYKKAMLVHNLEINDSYICSGEFTIQGGYEATKQLLGLKDAPTAIFAANGVMMKGVLHALSDLGKRIPEDISIISFDNVIDGYPLNDLSVVAQPMKEMGEKAMDILLERICEPASYKKNSMRLILNPTLILRGSERLYNKETMDK